jgi:hypothetical protein
MSGALLFQIFQVTEKTKAAEEMNDVVICTVPIDADALGGDC